MHWSLMTFERKRIDRIALDHPYFDTHAPLLTKKEIRGILSHKPQKTGPQVIAEVKRELGLNDVPVAQQKRTLMDALRDALFVPSFRRLIVLSTLCIILALFMTLTAPGRALAEEAYSIIIDFINGSFGARNNVPIGDLNDIDYSALPNGIQDPLSLARMIDCPIIVSNDSLQSFDYEALGNDALFIQSKYQSENGSYLIIQEIYGDGASWGTSAEFQNAAEIIRTDTGRMFYIGASNDEALIAVSLSEKSIIKCSSYEINLSSFADVLCNLFETSE